MKKMSLKLKILYICVVIFVGILFFGKFSSGATILQPFQGGTGLGVASPADVGDCLKVQDDSPFRYELGSCGSGGSGTPGGSNTQVQYNNAGSFGGMAGITFASSVLSMSDAVVNVTAAADATKIFVWDLSGQSTGTAATIKTANTANRIYTLPNLTGTFALTTNNLSVFAATTSAQLAGIISDETGSGALVFGTSPSFTTPTLGVASATSINKVAITAPATSATLTIDDGFTLHATGNVTALSGSHTGTSSGTNTGDQTTIVGITGTKAQFDTAVTDGNFLYVGDVTQYTDELAQDAIGAMVNTSLTYTDGTPLLALTSRTIGGVAFDGTANITVASATGNFAVSNGATSSGVFKILEDTDAGSNFATFQVPSLAADTVYVLPADDGDSTEQLTTDGSGNLTWEAAGSGSGAPTDADYLVGTANGSLSAEIVVGTSPGGELGGTWASPTIDSDAVLWNEIGDSGADASITMAGFETDFTSTLDSNGKAILTITNTDADTGADTDFIDLVHNDGTDANIFYFKATGDADGTPQVDYRFSQTAALIRPDLTVTGDLTITGDDLFMTTNTSGAILVADGTNFNPVVMSGDVSVSTTGTTTIASNSVALGTDTTGNYVADITAGTAIDVSGGGGETATVTVDVDTTEIEATTFGAGANASNAWTFNLSGTDPILTAVSTGFQINDFLQIGHAGTDGSLKIYSEDGATDHSTIFNPGIQTQDVVYTLPVDDGTSNQFLKTDGSGVLAWSTPAGSGDFVGPASSTDNAIVRFDSTTGKLGQNSGVIVGDANDITLTIADTTNVNGITITQSDADQSGVRVNYSGATGGTPIDYPFVGVSSDAGGLGPFYSFYHNSASPLGGDLIGGFDSWGKDSAGNDTLYTYFNSYISSPTNTTEIGGFVIGVLDGATNLIPIVDMRGTGVSMISDGDGALTLKGLGNGTDEDMTINLDDTSNTWDFSSSTGVTTASFGTIGITSGAVTASGKIIGNASLDVKNGATTAGVLSLFEDSDDGTNKATFNVPALAGDTAYILPPDDGDAGEQLQTNGTGTLTWEASGGSSITGTDTHVLFFDGANTPAGDAGMTYAKATDKLSLVGGVALDSQVLLKYDSGNGGFAIRNLADSGYMRSDVGDMYIRGAGGFTATFSDIAGGDVGLVNNAFFGTTGGLRLASGRITAWSSTTSYNGTADLALSREAAGVLSIDANTTAGSSGGWFNYGGQSRVNANVDNTTTTMANITGLSATVTAGRKYAGKITLYAVDSAAVDGLKVDFDGGTATMTSFRAHGTVFDTALLLSSQTTALATDFTVATITGDSMVEIYFSFVVNAGGTFIPRFAQNSHTTGTATAYANSYMIINDIP